MPRRVFRRRFLAGSMVVGFGSALDDVASRDMEDTRATTIMCRRHRFMGAMTGDGGGDMVNGSSLLTDCDGTYSMALILCGQRWQSFSRKEEEEDSLKND